MKTDETGTPSKVIVDRPDGAGYNFRYILTEWLHLQIVKLCVPTMARWAVSMLVVAAQCDKSFEELLAYKGTGEPRLVLELSAETTVA
jgi:hypothetical protein